MAMLHIENLCIQKAGHCQYFGNVFFQPGAVLGFDFAPNHYIHFVNNAHNQIILTINVQTSAIVSRTR